MKKIMLWAGVPLLGAGVIGMELAPVRGGGLYKFFLLLTLAGGLLLVVSRLACGWRPEDPLLKELADEDRGGKKKDDKTGAGVG
ncbi:MAG: hypothetical protein FD189_1267 [Elusimicrobia bacterium]|nr:MAG: hypothetical protein FD154_137 [Elusimicrobiota bacterium]KAF0155789.1 MAG: hypothetical protein FD189_1267 [Elusimicrobiota bacterium]